MNTNLTDIILVVDKSGSMYSIRSDAEGGINSLIKDQARLEGDCNLTLVEFSTDYNFVEEATPINEVKEYTLMPGGGTALLDAVGRAIVETGNRLRDMKEEDRPALVQMVIVTDGYENSSREYTREQIREMINHQRDKYNWQFTFLGADENSFNDAVSWGVRAADAAVYNVTNSKGTYASTSAMLRRKRDAYVNLGLEAVNLVNDITFTEEEREEMASDGTEAVSP